MKEQADCPRMFWATYIAIRVGFLPEEMYFFQDAQKKLENSYFFQFLPEEIGRN